MSNAIGRFITLEGSEGVGKSTNVAMVRDFLQAKGYEVITTREPGGTARAEAMRELLLNPNESEVLDDLSELLLVFAARAQHLARIIKPALARGAWVVCDRFTDATFAYQGAGRGGNREHIEQLERLVHQEVQPDLTLLLDMPVSSARQRLQARGLPPDRFEQEEGGFFERVRQGYRQRADQAPERFAIIDASAPLEEVQAGIRQVLEERLAQWR
ncbi:dTMP kinase [Kushneria phosphatilytica]|uniref:Thymidylate kinase n=1 Tax=Kushneria phosphatilytica TaxID=657387 RepID=A0A1S1NRF2_9GAMM|nr:dTMP kinase [Kushneria phosphatilytica]OHV11809.1 dTMP kinase [Kushneria phosphatilytica]QEL10974.1 dTMP kinase [Kushneria phosphatilytica]